MNPDYIFPIGQIYRKTQQEEEETSRFSDGKSHWVGNYENFKKNIKAHLRREQCGRCVFCRRIIDESQCPATIEHLLPKAIYPQFETLPENLVLSCFSCNSQKREKIPLIDSMQSVNLENYPQSASDFTIVYPYKDNYEDHIDIEEKTCLAFKKSAKGEKTISLYNLNRERLVSARKSDLEYKKNQKYIRR